MSFSFGLSHSVAAVLLVSFVLAGCGAGGDGEPTPEEAIAANNAAVDAAQGKESSEGTVTEQAPRNVRVLEVKTRDLTESLVLSGTLRPTRGADLSAEEAGVVSKIHRDKGAFVERGQQILSIDRRILSSEMKSAEAEEKLHSFNEERTRTLFDENSVSGQEMLLTHTQAEQARARAEIARVRHQRAAFPAPFPGIVSERYVEVGEYVTPGMRVVRILDPFKLELHGSVTERQVQNLEPGASVRVALEGADEAAEGTVSWIGFEADPSTGKFPVEIEIANPEVKLRPGILGRAEIETQIHRDVVAIPRDAVNQTTSGPVVFVAKGDRAERRSVRLGAEQGLLVVAREGVRAGEKLIVRGQRDLSDGSRIHIRETSKSPDGSMPGDPEVFRPDSGLDSDEGGES